MKFLKILGIVLISVSFAGGFLRGPDVRKKSSCGDKRCIYSSGSEAIGAPRLETNAAV